MIKYASMQLNAIMMLSFSFVNHRKDMQLFDRLKKSITQKRAFNFWEKFSEAIRLVH